ncbi:SRPBCC domain-containing protein [Tsukamurella paurometabola]|uniref:SRPBCC domain-containing protein n=1 Tax=Tsukamurella paurometabola TaxID=2061 RepID=A0ABS5NA79_TSUPA|nr:SRPBCC domain-containing protein [Tsukamurella paurometabola]MBS4101177.1 SRPBCC domain-containing protein [Tsukamurella paurometabola]
MTETAQTVTVFADVQPSVLFEALTRPAVHAAADGSGMLRGVSADSPETITGVGQTFGMEMTDEQGRPYSVDNHVVAFEPGARIAWLPAGRGKPPVGVEWSWEFIPEGDGTLVAVTCDWSRVTNEAYLARFTLPRVSADEVRATVDAVIATTRR